MLVLNLQSNMIEILRCLSELPSIKNAAKCHFTKSQQHGIGWNRNHILLIEDSAQYTSSLR